MRIPYGFILASDGVLNINKDEADVISMIFDFYIAGASLGKIVDILAFPALRYARRTNNKTCGQPQKKRDIRKDVSFLLVRRFCCAKTKAASGGP